MRTNFLEKWGLIEEQKKKPNNKKLNSPILPHTKQNSDILESTA